MPKDIFYPLRAFHGQMYEKKKENEKHRQHRKLLKSSTPDTIFLLGTPVHPNIGDNAIALAELMFLQKILPQDRPILEVTEEMFKKNKELVIQRIKKTGAGPIIWHGGGNMGDLWTDQERMRKTAFEAFGTKRIIAFPQTIYYSDTERGRSLAEASVPLYNGKPGLTLMAREPRSYEIMKALYPDTDIRLMPDIVLSASAEAFGVLPQQRSGVLMCLRNDVEKSVQDAVWETLKERIVQSCETFRVTDMDAGIMTDQQNRLEIVRKKMQEFRGAKLAVTDRLHGMVFAALTGTPCIVLSNYNHKVKSTYEWIRYLPFIRYADTLQEAELALPELLSVGECKFDNAPLIPFFDQLAEIVLEACR